MATIQLKRSNTTPVPASLANGEPAFTAAGNVFFIGVDGQVLPIAGQRTPGTLTPNQAIVTDSSSFIDQINVSNTVILGNTSADLKIYVDNSDWHIKSNNAVNIISSNNVQLQYNPDADAGGYYSNNSNWIYVDQNGVSIEILNSGGGVVSSVMVNSDGTRFIGNVTPYGSNYYSLGNSTVSWKDLYVGTSVIVGGVTITNTTLSSISGNAAANAAAAYTNAVSYIDSKNYANTSQLNANVSTLQSQITSNAATAYTNAVAYVDGKSYVNTAQLSGNVSVLQGQITTNVATAYTNAVAYVDGKSYVNTSQLSSNLSLYAPLAGATFTGSVVVANNLTVTGNLTLQGNAVIIGANNLIVNDAVISIHSPANGSPLTSNDGRNIGIAFHYYDTSDKHAALLRDNSTGYLAWYTDATDPNLDTNVVGNTFGTIQALSFVAGNSSVFSTTNATSFSGTSNNSTNFGGLSLATVQGQITGNAATAYTNAVAYVDGKSYVNTSQLNANVVTVQGQITSNAATAYTNAVSYVTAQSYVNTAQLSANVATLQSQITSNAATAYTNAVAYVDGKSYVNTSQLTNNLALYATVANPTFTGNVTTGNVLINTTGGIRANGSYGTTGQVLTSNGTTVFWTTPTTGTVTQVSTGSGLAGGPITSTGTVSILANNGTVANSTGLFVNANTGIVANTTGVFVNATYIGTISANNSTYLNGQLASYYTNATNITTGTLPWAQAPTGTVNTSGAFTFSGIQTFNSNVVIGATGELVFNTAAGIYANGSLGTSGQVLTSNGTTVFWTTPTTGTVTQVSTGNGLAGGPITSTGTVSVLANSGIVANTTGLFVNSAYIGTLTANNSTNFGGLSLATVQGQITGNAATAYTNAVSYVTAQSYANTLQVTANAATAYTNAVAYVDGKSYVNTAQLTNNLANYVTSTNLTNNLANYVTSTNLTNNLANYVTSTNLTNNLTNYVTTTNLTNNLALYATLANPTFTGNVTTGNVIINTTGGIRANGSYGTSGQVLTSNGTTVYWAAAAGGFTNGQSISVNNFVISGTLTANGANGSSGQALLSNGTGIYWGATGTGSVSSVDTGNGLTGGPITSSGTIAVLANSGIVANTTGVFVNDSYIATLTANNSTNFGGLSLATVQSQITGNAATAYTNAVSYVTAQSYANTLQVTSNAATAYTNAVSYVTNQSYVNTAQLSGNLALYAQLSGATFTGALVANNVTITGNLTLTGNTVIIGANNLVVNDAVISLHSPANGSPLTVNDGKNIGVSFHYYDTSDQHALLVRENSTGRLTWYTTSTDPNTGDAVGNTLGVIQASSYWAGNSTVFSTINATSFTGTSNNSTNFGGLSLATVQGQITGNAATAYTNAVAYVDGKSYVNTSQLTNNLANYVTTTNLTNNLANYVTSTNLTNNLANYVTGTNLTNNLASYVTTTNLTNNLALYATLANPTFTGNVTTGNVIINTTGGIRANGSYGTTGQVLTSNATTVYWSTPTTGTVTQVSTGSGLTGGPITSTGTVSVLANSGIVANTTGIFVNANTGIVSNTTGVYVNASYIATLTANNSTNFGGLSLATVQGQITGNAATAYTNAVSYVTAQSYANTLQVTSNAATAYTNAVAYVTAQSYVNTAQLTNNLASYVTTTNLTNNLANYVTSTNLTNNLANYVTTTNLTNNLANYVTSTNLTNNLALYATLANPTFTGNVATSNVVISGNLTISATGELIINSSAGIYANGSLGTDGQVLTSNGTAVYWSTVTSGGAGVNTAAQYTWTNTQTFQANVSFTSTAASGNATSGGVLLSGGLGVANNIYTAGRFGFSNSTNISVAYQYYNASNNSIDTVFG